MKLPEQNTKPPADRNCFFVHVRVKSIDRDDAEGPGFVGANDAVRSRSGRPLAG
jgi:hypothetical protein